MKVLIIGGTGLIGSKLVANLRQDGHQVVPASPDTGVNSITGDGVADAIRDASVLVDVSNSPSFEPSAVMNFFHDLHAQSSRVRNSSGRETLRRSIGGGNRANA